MALQFPRVNSTRRLRSLFLWASAILLASALALAAYWHFWWRRPPGFGSVALPVTAESFRQPWTERRVLLVGLGDSVTAGFGAAKGRSYFDRLAGPSARDEYPELRELNLRAVLPNLTVTNLSVSGSTSLQHVRQQLPRLTRQHPDTLGIIVLTTGGNDLIHNYGRTEPSVSSRSISLRSRSCTGRPVSSPCRSSHFARGTLCSSSSSDGTMSAPTDF